MSIYRRICAAITDNTLPKDFYIDSNAPSKKIRFAPGAMDGIMMYSMGVSQKECPDDLIREIIAASPENTYNTEAVERVLDGQYMLSIIDDLQGKIKGNADMKNTFLLGMQLITESDSTEAVKLGLSLLELFNTEDYPEVSETISKLALYEEFTLFCGFIIRYYHDADDRLMEIASHINGWGKIFIVNDLLGNSEKVGSWLIRYGCRNNILNNYTAYRIAERTGLEAMLKERSPEFFDDEELRGIADIVSGLLDEEPCSGLSALNDPDGFLNDIAKLFTVNRSPQSAEILGMIEKSQENKE